MSTDVPFPSPTQLQENLGVLFTGYSLSIIGYGFTFFQTYIYFSQYGSNSTGLKLLVGTVLYGASFIPDTRLRDSSALDTISSVLLSDITYFYMVTTFPFLGGLLSFDPKFAGYLLLSVITAFIVQLFYAFDFWKLQENRVVSSTVGVIAILAFALGLGAYAVTHVTFLSSSRSGGCPYLERLGCCSLVNASHGGGDRPFPHIYFPGGCLDRICAKPSENPDNVTYRLKHRLIKLTPCSLRRIRRIPATFVYLIPYGGLGAAVQFSCLVVFVARPHKLFWVPFHLVANKLFVNGLLYMLDARRTSGHDSMKTGTGVAAKSAISTIAFGGGPSQTSQGTRVNISTSTQVDQDVELPKTPIDNVCRSSIASLFLSDCRQQ
ncbi:hypothetical protein B0H12DRAFT_1325556 [Mycena haematopus]|nr:hypothetical protein B0H12DRAFT_1325556 [Mycena haematopus]